ncbi:MAG: hypothetical protein AAB288_11545 [Acidobacteriota bacterium]
MRAFLFTLTILFAGTFVQAQGVEQLELKNGEQKTTKTGRVTIKFLELIEDSRCPADVNCVWAGVARIKVRLSKNGKSADFELNTNQADKPAVFRGLSVALRDLKPRQSTTSKYSPSAYSAVLTVSRPKP